MWCVCVHVDLYIVWRGKENGKNFVFDKGRGRYVWKFDKKHISVIVLIRSE